MSDVQWTERTVQTKPWNVHLHDVGEGPAVVLLHGSGPGATGTSNYAPNIEPLASAGLRVLAVDMPGWGSSDSPAPGEPRDHVATLLSLMDELEIERASLVGNSMGGMTTLRFAVEYPDRVDRIVTMGAPSPRRPGLLSPAGFSEGMKILLATYADPSPDNYRRLVEIMCFDPAFATDELVEARTAAAAERPEHLSNFLGTIRDPAAGGMGAFFALGSRLGEIAAPALIIHGRDDRTVNFENSLHLVAAIPDSRLLVFNRCGHWAQIEHAAEFNKVVAGFLAP
jgi:2-hydroxy-6-oxonona-2,4-dienedioate hydrolase